MDVLLCKKNYRADKSTLNGWGRSIEEISFRSLGHYFSFGEESIAIG